MKLPLKISEEKKPLLYSLGVHLFILLTMVVRPYFSPTIKPFEKSIRVDIISMPDKHQKIIKKEKSSVGKKVEKKAKKVVSKKKSKPKSETKLIKKSDKKTASKTKKGSKKKKEVPPKEDTGEEDAFAKLARLREEKSVEVEKQKAIAGNRVSKGTDLTGVEKLEYSNYRSILHTAISSEWDVPKWLLEGNLSAVAHIKIDEDGNLTYKKITRSSGNSIYDEKVMEAIVAAAPMSPPPEKFKQIVYYEGVELSFPR